MAETEKPAESPRPIRKGEPVTDPYNIPVMVVDDIGPSGFTNGVGRLTLISFRLAPGTPGGEAGPRLDPVVCARLRFSASIAVQLRDLLGTIVQQAADEEAAKKQAN